ncbi:hypothetical protein [Micropruina sp.]|uniref:hypothetical protein n=1 Tax=Micropruina sp. TaxID=2737536 RepID=UPI0039E5BCB1
MPDPAEQAVTRFLQHAATPPMPEAVRARLRATIAAETELRRASRVEPDHDVPDLKPISPLWSDDPVSDR